MSRLATHLVGDLLLAVYGESNPSDADFSAAMVNFKNADPSRSRLLVLTLGGGPTTLQRSQLNTLLNGRTMRTAIVYEIDSVILRNLITATSWFNKGVKAFPSRELHDALRYLEITAAQFPEVRRELERLREVVCRVPADPGRA